MTHPKLRSIGSTLTSPKAQILASLSYLAKNCAMTECQLILEMALDLCVQCGAHEEDGDSVFHGISVSKRREGLSDALTFLRAEATRNRMGDFATILEAASTFVEYYLIQHCHGERPSVVEH